MTRARVPQPPTLRTRIVKCPRCHKESIYSQDNRWRPFCSQHCYNLDLGAWASEGYRIGNDNGTDEDDADNPTHPDNYGDR